MRHSFPIFHFPAFIFSLPPSRHFVPFAVKNSAAVHRINPVPHPAPIRGQKCLGMIRTNLTTDGTDTIWIKDQFRVSRFSTFPLSSFPSALPWSIFVFLVFFVADRRLEARGERRKVRGYGSWVIGPTPSFLIFYFLTFIFSAAGSRKN